MYLSHGILCGGREFGGETEFALGAEDDEGGDMAVTVGALSLHLGEDVANDATVVIVVDMEKLRPREDLLEVVVWEKGEHQREEKR